MIGAAEADAMLNRLRGLAAGAVAAELALYSGDPASGGTELSGGDYARRILAPTDWAPPAAATPTGRTIATAGEIELSPNTAASWGTATHWAVVDAQGIRWSGALGSSIPIGAGARVVIPAGGIALRLAAETTMPRAAVDASIAFVGNSYSQNFGGLPALLSHYLGVRLPANTLSLGPPPAPADTIGDADGWYTGMTLGGMALYPTIDQSGGVGTEDAVDAIVAQGAGAYDHVVLTSDFRRIQDVNVAAGIDWEVLPGAGGSTPALYGVVLEVVRRVVDRLRTGGSNAQPLVRMTHEGVNANDDTDLADFERTVRLQILAARQLEDEGVAATVPDHYVWWRLTAGASGPVGSGLGSPVPAYAGLVHDNSLQPGGQNVAWLNRSQGDTAPFGRNGHQNAIAMIVQTWLWGYVLWRVDPRGDTTFTDPAALPAPFHEFISPDGQRIYGGHATGAGNWPYDPTVNPAGPPDAQLDLDWSLTTQAQIQDRIVAVVSDFYNHATEFDT